MPQIPNWLGRTWTTLARTGRGSGGEHCQLGVQSTSTWPVWRPRCWPWPKPRQARAHRRGHRNGRPVSYRGTTFGSAALRVHQCGRSRHTRRCRPFLGRSRTKARPGILAAQCADVVLTWPLRDQIWAFELLFCCGAAGNRTRVLRHSLKASPCAVRYASTRISRSREPARMTIPVAVSVPLSPATGLNGGSL